MLLLFCLAALVGSERSRCNHCGEVGQTDRLIEGERPEKGADGEGGNVSVLTDNKGESVSDALVWTVTFRRVEVDKVSRSNRSG